VLRRTLPIALLATALLAGCGGGDTGPQTKEGFISAADGVCENVQSDIQRAGAADPQTPQQVAEANKVLADLYGKLADDLAKVRLPEAGTARRQAQMFVASVRTADPLVEKLRAASKDFVTAAESQDRQAAATAGNEVRSALDAFRAARATSDRLALQYGLNICGNLG
jgi:hypothetical protein